MASFRITFEDFSPFIVYTSDWAPATDSRLSYSLSSVTSKAGGTATITFNGTGITVYGSKRSSAGQYQAVLDGGAKNTFNGYQTPDVFQVSKYEVHGLTQGTHQVVMTNTEDQKLLTVDFVTIEGTLDDGGKNGTVVVNNFDDTHTNFQYLPSKDAWSTNPDSVGSFFGMTGHATTTPGASFLFTFEGQGVTLYGPKSINGAAYSVSLDGGSSNAYSSAQDRYLPQTILYHVTNIGSGKHTLKVSYTAQSSGQAFAVDYANVYTVSTDGSSNPGGSSPSPSSGSTNTSPGNSSSNFSTGAIVGVALAGVAVILFGAILVFLLRRNKQKQLQEHVQMFNVQHSPSQEHLHSETSRMATLEGPQFVSGVARRTGAQDSGTKYSGLTATSSNTYSEGTSLDVARAPFHKTSMPVFSDGGHQLHPPNHAANPPDYTI